MSFLLNHNFINLLQSCFLKAENEALCYASFCTLFKFVSNCSEIITESTRAEVFVQWVSIQLCLSLTLQSVSDEWVCLPIAVNSGARESEDEQERER